MSHLLIKYSIFVLYGREILVVIRVPPQRETLQYIRPGVKITAPTKMLISVNFIVDTRRHILFWQKGGRSNFIADFAKIWSSKRWTLSLSLSLELCPFPGYCKSSGFELSVRRLTRSSFNFLPSSSSIFIGDYWIEIIRTIVSLYQASRESFILSSESEFLIIFRKRSRSFVLKNRIGSGTSHRWN